METKRYYLGLVVIIGILCASILGEVEPDLPDVTLIGQPEPALRGIRQLYVIVITHNAEPNKSGLVFEKLENSAADKLKEAGITIVETDVEKLEPNSPGAKAAKILRRSENADIRNLKYIHALIPELRINVEVLDIKDSQQVVFRVQTSLARLVYLEKQNQSNLKTDVWKTEPVMQSVSAENMPATVNSVVLEQVEEFIHAHLAANSQEKQVSDKTHTGIIPKERPRPIVKSTPVEHKYVASKNSNVFHSPDCGSAKRIKPENLVGYSSRAEAINAGKRPCKRCKP